MSIPLRGARRGNSAQQQPPSPSPPFFGESSNTSSLSPPQPQTHTQPHSSSIRTPSVVQHAGVGGVGSVGGIAHVSPTAPYYTTDVADLTLTSSPTERSFASSAGVSMARGGKKEKGQFIPPPTCKVRLSEGLLCADFLSAFNALAIGSTRNVHILEVMQKPVSSTLVTSRMPSTLHGLNTMGSTTSLGPNSTTGTTRPSVPMALRPCGLFGGLANVETLAWYPSNEEATLALVQLSRSVTILIDALTFKAGRSGYMAQQWIRNARDRNVASAMHPSNDPLNTAVVGSWASVPSTPAARSSSMCSNSPIKKDSTPPQTAVRGVGTSRAMVEVVINTATTRVERLAWDPHNPYTIALTSNTTHFELWTIPISGTTVHPPRLILRPPAYNEQATTRGIAFSPSDPNLIIVVAEVAKGGRIILYDRRQVEVPRYVNTTGPCLTIAFHPNFCDLLAVCYRREKTKSDSRVQFFRVLDEVTAHWPTHNPSSGALDGTPHLSPPMEGTAVMEQALIPPVDTFAPLNRLRWRPTPNRGRVWTLDADAQGGNMNDTGNMNRNRSHQHQQPSISNNNDNNNNNDHNFSNHNHIHESSGVSKGLEVISKQLWFATVALSNAQDISVWDAANGFCPIFSIKSANDGREPTDCVWVNPLALVSIFKGGEVVLTSLLDESADSDGSLRPLGSTPVLGQDDANVFSLGAILPTAAVVADYFGRSFVARNTSTQLREYYARVIQTESPEVIEQLSAAEAFETGQRFPSTPSGGMGRSSTTLHGRDSAMGTPIGWSQVVEARFSPQQQPLAQSPLARTHSTTPPLTNPSTTPTIASAAVASKPAREGGFRKLIDKFRSGTSSERTPQQRRPQPSSTPPQPQPQPPQQQQQQQQQSQIALAAGTPPTPHFTAENTVDGAGLEHSHSPHTQQQQQQQQQNGLALVFPTLIALAKRHRSLPAEVEVCGAEEEQPWTLLSSTSRGATQRPRTSNRSIAGIADMSPTKLGDTTRALESDTYQPLGARFLVAPVIERFLLADAACAWAYTEESNEAVRFIRCALDWEVGYEMARHMRSTWHAVGSNHTALNGRQTPHQMDRRFARMMERNARVCGAGSDAKSESTMDPRAEQWAAAAHSWRSHSVELITSFVCGQLNYASLIGDVQYCAVLYLLYSLWWRQRQHASGVQVHSCPLMPHRNDPPKNTENKKAFEERHLWWRRALQWIEQYVARLYERQLYVALNELLLIVPVVTGEPVNPVQPRAAEIAHEKQMTYVFCGTCPKGELIASITRGGRAGRSGGGGGGGGGDGEMLDPVNGTSGSNGESSCTNDDDDDSLFISSDSASGSSRSPSSSSSIPSSQRKSATQGISAKRGKHTPFHGAHAFAPLVSARGGPAHAAPRNATCPCHPKSTQMTCVICEEVVEGMYVWLRSCGHGGHAHHLEEWLRVANECPRCGVAILSPEEVSTSV